MNIKKHIDPPKCLINGCNKAGYYFLIDTNEDYNICSKHFDEFKDDEDQIALDDVMYQTGVYTCSEDEDGNGCEICEEMRSR